MKRLKYVYFCAQKSIIEAGNRKFHDLINVPRTLVLILQVNFESRIIY